LEPGKVGILIHSSIYKDENIGEPAVASFIQRDIDANQLSDGTSSTFSFDILDGGCGLISGMELIDGFISSGEIEHGVVVTSDVNPSVRNTIGFKFKNSASAIVLGRSDNGSGFRSFHQYEYPEHMDELKSTVEFMKDPRRNFVGMRRMRNILRIEESPSFRSSVFEKVTGSLDRFIDDSDIQMKDVDLIVPIQYPEGLPDHIAGKTGLGNKKVVELPKHYGPLYTTGPGFALRWAMKKGFWDRSRNIVFIGISPGIKVLCALYRNERPVQ
jgi:3-oxoacyl-[acyl-carrier-protein] synthase-3